MSETQHKELIEFLTVQFSKIEREFEYMHKQFEYMHKKFDEIDARFAGIEERLDKLEKRYQNLDNRVTALEIGQDKILKEIIAFREHSSIVNYKFGRIETWINKASSKINLLYEA